MQVNTPSITPTSRSWFLLALNQEGVSHLLSVYVCLWDFNGFYIVNVMEYTRYDRVNRLEVGMELKG